MQDPVLSALRHPLGSRDVFPVNRAGLLYFLRPSRWQRSILKSSGTFLVFLGRRQGSVLGATHY